MDSPLVKYAHASLPDQLRPATKISYVTNLLALYRLLHGGRDPKSPSIAWFKNRKNIARLPGLVAEDPVCKSAHSAYTRINNGAAIAMHLGCASTHLALKNAAAKLRAPRDALLDQGDCGETLKANYVAFAQLVDRVKTELLPPFDSLPDDFAETRADRVVILRALLGVLNVFEPQMRSVYGNCKVVTSDPGDLYEDGPNVLEIREDGRCTVHVVNDKVSGPDGIGMDSWDLGQAASDVVTRAQEMWPRVWLFPRTPMVDLPQTSKPYLEAIGRLFTFGTRVATANVIRHATVDAFYDKYPSPSYAQKAYLARRMRHSVATQETVYRKCAEGDPVDLPGVDDNNDGS